VRVSIQIARSDGRAASAPRRPGSSTTRKVLASLVVLGLIGGVGAVGSYSAFTATTTNTGNTFQAGSVAIDDNDNDTAMLALSNAKPGDSDTSCIRVRYTGSLASTVRTYASVTGTLPQYLTLTVTRGTNPGAFDSCGSFDTTGEGNYIGAGAGVVYQGNLSAFPASYAAGLVDPTSGSPESWTTNETHWYRFVVTLQDNDAAKGLTGGATFTWEARNS